MYLEEMPLFKELMPYSGQIDRNNRWIKLGELVPWEIMERLYLKHFDARKHQNVKPCRLTMGLMLGQMLLEQSNVKIVEHFHENPYFQYFCGQSTFIPKGRKAIVHHSLLTKRRSRLGKVFMSDFESAVLEVLKERGLIKGQKLILDATVFPADISYPNDVKVLNSAREWCCKTVLKVKNTLDPNRKIRTVRKTARRTYLNFQKKKKKSMAFIRKTRNQMRRYLKRNITQLEALLTEIESQIRAGRTLIKKKALTHIKAQFDVAKTIYDQQTHLATTRGRRVADRIVSFSQPSVRPIIRGKEGKPVEFGAKAHGALVDGYAFLDDCQFTAFHEGKQLPDCLDKHESRFGRLPDIVLADQLYATWTNRALLKEKNIAHSFKRAGRPPTSSSKEDRTYRSTFKKRQGQRNHIEGLFGTLKNHFHLDRIRWTVTDGADMQIRLGFIASNLHRAVAHA